MALCSRHPRLAASSVRAFGDGRRGNFCLELARRVLPAMCAGHPGFAALCQRDLLLAAEYAGGSDPPPSLGLPGADLPLPPAPADNMRLADMPRLAIVLPVVAAEFGKGQLRDGGDAVIALLPMHRAVGVAKAFEGGMRKQMLGHLDLLQAQHIGLLLGKKTLDLIEAETDGVDVPGSDRDHAARHKAFDGKVQSV